jgi:hypothetical protein
MALDGIDGSILNDGDVALAIENGAVHFYALDADSGATESSPEVISPNENAEDKRWILQGIVGKFRERAFLPIEDAIDGIVQAPAALETITSTNGKVKVRKFDPSTDEDVIWRWPVPKDIVAADGIKFQVETWVTESGTSTSGLAFALQGYSVGDGDDLNGAYGSPVVSSAAGLSIDQYKRFTTELSSVVTITDLAAGETAMLNLLRDVDDTNDDYASDIGVSGIWVEWTRQTLSQ